MKDLYGVRKQDLEKLADLGLLPSDAITQEDGNSDNGEQLYSIFFNTSAEKQVAFNAIYG